MQYFGPLEKYLFYAVECPKRQKKQQNYQFGTLFGQKCFKTAEISTSMKMQKSTSFMLKNEPMEW